MPQWVVNPATIVVAVVAVVTAIFWVGSWYGGVNSDRTTFKTFMENVGANIDSIKENVGKIFGRLDNLDQSVARLDQSIAGANSPLNLTEYGLKLAGQLKAEEWARLLAPDLEGSVAGKQAFQVNEFCKEHTKTLTINNSPDVFALSYKHGITEENMRGVLALVLRDELLDRLGIEDS